MISNSLSDLENINQSLDKTLINAFDEIEEYFTIRLKLDTCLSDGFIQMAKTRSITGVHSVSKLQYNLVEESKARFKVTAIKDKFIEPELTHNETTLKKAKVCFKLNDTEIEDLEHTLKQNLNIKNKLNLNLKQRKNVQTNDTQECFVNDTLDTDLKNKESPTKPTLASSSLNQPLNWFGILVPGSLRNSQESFVKATALIVDLVQCQENVLDLMQQYRALKEIVVKAEEKEN